MGAPQDNFDRQDIENEISGHIYGVAGQFGNVYGDVHVHGPSTPHPPNNEPSRQDAPVEKKVGKKQGGVEAKRMRREAAEQARLQRRDEDRKTIRGCGFLVLLLGVPGFVTLGLYTQEWLTAGVLTGVVAIILFLWGAGVAMHDD
ncbi:hypothetical protein [Streptomyces sp. NPDC004042]|uniref:hypothetical protein n=1 Tax=Streptomyces sp. NPDC004042 TaxID=3154451 RepID=UPI0033B31E6B